MIDLLFPNDHSNSSGESGQTARVDLIQSGKTLTVCEGNVYDKTGEKLIARMTARIMAIDNK